MSFNEFKSKLQGNIQDVGYSYYKNAFEKSNRDQKKQWKRVLKRSNDDITVVLLRINWKLGTCVIGSFCVRLKPQATDAIHKFCI